MPLTVASPRPSLSPDALRTPEAATSAYLAASSYWFTGAGTELITPTAVEASDGVDVTLAAGPRTYETGARARVSALSTNGRVLAQADSRVKPLAPPSVVRLQPLPRLPPESPRAAPAPRGDRAFATWSMGGSTD